MEYVVCLLLVCSLHLVQGGPRDSIPDVQCDRPMLVNTGRQTLYTSLSCWTRKVSPEPSCTFEKEDSQTGDYTKVKQLSSHLATSSKGYLKASCDLIMTADGASGSYLVKFNFDANNKTDPMKMHIRIGYPPVTMATCSQSLSSDKWLDYKSNYYNTTKCRVFKEKESRRFASAITSNNTVDALCVDGYVEDYTGSVLLKMIEEKSCRKCPDSVCRREAVLDIILKEGEAISDVTIVGLTVDDVQVEMLEVLFGNTYRVILSFLPRLGHSIAFRLLSYSLSSPREVVECYAHEDPLQLRFPNQTREFEMAAGDTAVVQFEGVGYLAPFDKTLKKVVNRTKEGFTQIESTIVDTSRYDITCQSIDGNSWEVNLTLVQVQVSDFGHYRIDIATGMATNLSFGFNIAQRRGPLRLRHPNETREFEVLEGDAGLVKFDIFGHPGPIGHTLKRVPDSTKANCTQNSPVVNSNHYNITYIELEEYSWEVNVILFEIKPTVFEHYCLDINNGFGTNFSFEFYVVQRGGEGDFDENEGSHGIWKPTLGFVSLSIVIIALVIIIFIILRRKKKDPMPGLETADQAAQVPDISHVDTEDQSLPRDSKNANESLRGLETDDQITKVSDSGHVDTQAQSGSRDSAGVTGYEGAGDAGGQNDFHLASSEDIYTTIDDVLSCRIVYHLHDNARDNMGYELSENVSLESLDLSVQYRHSSDHDDPGSLDLSFPYRHSSDHDDPGDRGDPVYTQVDMKPGRSPFDGNTLHDDARTGYIILMVPKELSQQACSFDSATTNVPPKHGSVSDEWVPLHDNARDGIGCDMIPMLPMAPSLEAPGLSTTTSGVPSVPCSEDRVPDNCEVSDNIRGTATPERDPCPKNARDSPGDDIAIEPMTPRMAVRGTDTTVANSPQEHESKGSMASTPESMKLESQALPENDG